VQGRVEYLLARVLRGLLDRGRKVRVSFDRYDWTKPTRSATFLDDQDWGNLRATVDGIEFCFQWTPTRDADHKEYATDRAHIRWCASVRGSYDRGKWRPSSDVVRLIEPTKHKFDPSEVINMFEVWLVERKQARDVARERANAEERRAALQAQLQKRADAALPSIGAVEAQVSVRSNEQDAQRVRLAVTWNVSPARFDELLATLRAAAEQADQRATEAAFTLE
jgi:hypothetical protein